MPQQQLFPDEVARFRAEYKIKGLVPEVVNGFHDIIMQHYAARGRIFPFREPAHYNDPYKVVVSEIMLQQTQADRVVDKYLAFLKVFPDFNTLASAPVDAVLRSWVGLGYNRRALALKQIAEAVISRHDGKLPSNVETLDEFPSIGPNTAASIATFAFNTAVPFIETNIRAVYTHFFFHDTAGVKDDAILDIVTKTLDKDNPREWYYALMDYGVLLKKTGQAPVKKNVLRSKPAAFQGSDRQVRGNILKLLLATPKSIAAIAANMGEDETRVARLVSQLEKEGFLANEKGSFQIKK